MKYIFSGLDHAWWQSVSESVEALSCDVQWAEPSAFLARPSELRDEATRLVWVFTTPAKAVLAAQGKHAEPLDEVLRSWKSQNAEALNLRAMLGAHLIFVDQAGLADGGLAQLVGVSGACADVDCPGENDVLEVMLLEVLLQQDTELTRVMDALRAAGIVLGSEQLPAKLNISEIVSAVKTALHHRSLEDSRVLQMTAQQGQVQESLSELVTERDLLQTQLHQVHEELEAYYIRNRSLSREIAERPRQLALDALRLQLATTNSELQRLISLQGDLSRIHSRRLLVTVAARLERRFLGGRLSRYYRGRALQSELKPLRASKWFDSKWYLATYPDVATSGIEPLSHYHRFGWKEGRNPGPVFDSTYYLNANADVRDTDMNPLLHFVLYGEREGRLPSPR